MLVKLVFTLKKEMPDEMGEVVFPCSQWFFHMFLGDVHAVKGHRFAVRSNVLVVSPLHRFVRSRLLLEGIFEQCAKFAPSVLLNEFCALPGVIRGTHLQGSKTFLLCVCVGLKILVLVTERASVNDHGGTPKGTSS